MCTILQLAVEELRENYEKEKVKLDAMQPEKVPQTADGISNAFGHSFLFV